MGRASSRHARTALIAGAIVAIAATILWAMGRTPICTCGTVKIWHGAVTSAENSQHLADWYSLSHVNHGLIFYAVGWLFLRRTPVRLRFLIATGVEAAWEVLENSPIIIDRYRSVTAAFGYTGDSIVNSVSDIAMMMLGFWLARRLPAWGGAIAFVVFEVIALAAIRDNLTLNVWMLLAPNAAVREWQAAGQ